MPIKNPTQLLATARRRREAPTFFLIKRLPKIKAALALLKMQTLR